MKLFTFALVFVALIGAQSPPLPSGYCRTDAPRCPSNAVTAQAEGPVTIILTADLWTAIEKARVNNCNWLTNQNTGAKTCVATYETKEAYYKALIQRHHREILGQILDNFPSIIVQNAKADAATKEKVLNDTKEAAIAVK